MCPPLLAAALLSTAAATTTWYRAETELTVRQSGPWPSFARLPFEAQYSVRPDVWAQASTSAGVVILFDRVGGSRCGDGILINASLTSGSLDMPHMPATGVSGFDLYAWDDAEVQGFRWAAGWVPKWGQQARTVGSLASGLNPSLTRFALYLPLYNGVSDLLLGVPGGRGCVLRPAAVRPMGSGSVIVYGTSVTQGGVVSRPGAAWTNVLGRSLKRDVYNFGFSGNGEMETDVMQYLLRVPNISAIVVDCNMNMHGAHADCGGTAPCSGAAAIRYRAPRLVRFVRSHRGHHTTPIYMAAGTSYGTDWVGGPTQHAEYSAALAAAVTELRSAGDNFVTMLTGEEFYDEGDAYSMDRDTPTVAGCHPSDLGHWRIAARWHRVLAPILWPDDAALSRLMPLPPPHLFRQALPP
eukprot:COSAG01_NODE_3573_length_5920_cov_3.554372_1_plen_410_part_00